MRTEKMQSERRLWIELQIWSELRLRSKRRIWSKRRRQIEQMLNKQWLRSRRRT
jgi:hypothetical protein